LSKGKTDLKYENLSVRERYRSGGCEAAIL
jgi:hypothetical protein